MGTLTSHVPLLSEESVNCRPQTAPTGPSHHISWLPCRAPHCCSTAPTPTCRVATGLLSSHFNSRAEAHRRSLHTWQPSSARRVLGIPIWQAFSHPPNRCPPPPGPPLVAIPAEKIRSVSNRSCPQVSSRGRRGSIDSRTHGVPEPPVQPFAAPGSTQLMPHFYYLPT